MKNEQPAFEFDLAIDKKTFAWLVLAVTVVGLMSAAVVQDNDRREAHAGTINHSRDFVRETDSILTSLYAAEAAQQIYIARGDEGSKKVAAEKFAAVDEHLKIATKVALDNAEQMDRLGAIAALLQKRIDLNKDAARQMPLGAFQAAKLFTTVEALGNLAELEKLVTANRGAENRAALEGEQIIARNSRRTAQILFGGAGLVVALLGLAFRGVRHDLKLRRSVIETLEEKLQERGAELNATNEKLQLENMGQKWGQAALRRVVNHHELLLSSIREGVFVVSKNGRIISANPAAANLVRREAKQLAGKPICSVLLDADRLPFPWEKHFLRSPLKNGRGVPLSPATIKQADGSLLDVQMACHPTRDQENLTGAVITVSSAAG